MKKKMNWLPYIVYAGLFKKAFCKILGDTLWINWISKRFWISDQISRIEIFKEKNSDFEMLFINQSKTDSRSSKQIISCQVKSVFQRMLEQI